MSNYHVERMNRDEVTLAVDWARAEGWNPGLHDAECFYQTDPQGFFAGKLNNQIIAVGSAVIYDEHFAFCGFYIVDEKYRARGYGMQLTEARLAYIGNRNAGIDGVLEMTDNYERIGYRFAHNNARYALENRRISVHPLEYIIDLKNIPFEQLVTYDRRHFPAPRARFLINWIKQDQALALAYVKEGQLQGYGVIRKCFNGYKIGPLFADSAAIATHLFEQLVTHARGESVFLDIPENNPFAVDLVQHYGMTKVFATARMYLKGAPKLSIEGIYGITSFELG
ncbi:GNAT family N-acetyltransferase [Legionella saoudiensis]|uniref:GNAT family N-acetyltransferase n=1 Tax=Legionella saoudiensis TaxID=1750561 RepID=UPI00073065E1|nr:GNAT family N-acetyltransferase [Legionella saoudiensis]